MKFDCGNRTDGCDNATICPCLIFMNKELESYKELLKDSLFKEIIENEGRKDR